MADTSGRDFNKGQKSGSKDIKWLNQVGDDDFAGAASTLYDMSREEANIQKKKTILCLCKLSALISGNLTTFRDIDTQLEEIEFKQTQSSMEQH